MAGSSHPTVVSLGDGEAQPAYGAQIRDVNLVHVGDIGFRWWARSNKSDGPERGCDGCDAYQHRYEDDHRSISIIVPFAKPPPSHMV